MPLLHQTMTRPFGLDRQAIEHARLADGEIADVDHLLHLAFAFRDDLPSLQRDQLTELVFQFAQGVAKTANGLAAHWPGRDAPFKKRFLRSCNCLVVIFVRSRAHAGESLSINRRDFVDLGATSAPFAAEDAGIVIGQAEFIKNCLHAYLRRCLQNLRINSIASSITSAVISSGGRKRIEFSPERSVRTPRSKNPFQNCSRGFGSGRSKARKRPRPRAAEIAVSSRCRSRS